MILFPSPVSTLPPLRFLPRGRYCRRLRRQERLSTSTLNSRADIGSGLSGFGWLPGFTCLLSAPTDFIVGAFPEYSVPNLLFDALFTLGRAFLAAWFLASWVCLYRASQTLPKEIRF